MSEGAGRAEGTGSDFPVLAQGSFVLANEVRLFLIGPHWLREQQRTD